MKLKDLIVENVIHKYGLTEITDHGKTIHIYHGGNMGHRENVEVRNNVDKMLGRGAFEFLRPHGEFKRDKHNVYSDPSYMYVLIVPKVHYMQWVGKMDQFKASPAGRRMARESVNEGKTRRFEKPKAPRAEHLAAVMAGRKGGSHYTEKTDYKRAKEKAKVRKQIQDEV